MNMMRNLTKSIWPRRSPPRDEIARRGRSALRLPWAKSVAMTTVALRTEEFWKRLLRQDEAGRSGHPSRRSASRRLVRGTTQAPTPAPRAVLSRPRPLTRDGISPQMTGRGAAALVAVIVLVGTVLLWGSQHGLFGVTP